MVRLDLYGHIAPDQLRNLVLTPNFQHHIDSEVRVVLEVSPGVRDRGQEDALASDSDQLILCFAGRGHRRDLFVPSPGWHTRALSYGGFQAVEHWVLDAIPDHE